MDFFDNALGKAKEAIDIVSKKTGEVVNTQKQKFDIASIENKRSKDFEKLGEIYYAILKDTDIEDENTKALVDAITQKDEEIMRHNTELNKLKNQKKCEFCNAVIGKDAVFCPICGKKINE